MIWQQGLGNWLISERAACAALANRRKAIVSRNGEIIEHELNLPFVNRSQLATHSRNFASEETGSSHIRLGSRDVLRNVTETLPWFEMNLVVRSGRFYGKGVY